MEEKTKEELLKSLFSSFSTGVRAPKSEKARAWLQKYGLNLEEIQIGFNSGQFHHRKSEEFRNDYVRIRVLKESDANVRVPGMKAYTCFGSFGIIFPLKNQVGQIVNLFAIRFNLETEKCEYLNEEGLYPGYPHSLTKRLYITNDILSAATLLQTKVLESRNAVLALRDGEFSHEHYSIIAQLEHLTEIILIQ